MENNKERRNKIELKRQAAIYRKGRQVRTGSCGRNRIHVVVRSRAIREGNKGACHNVEPETGNLSMRNEFTNERAQARIAGEQCI